MSHVDVAMSNASAGEEEEEGLEAEAVAGQSQRESERAVGE